jgi:hypothetical protein
MDGCSSRSIPLSLYPGKISQSPGHPQAQPWQLPAIAYSTLKPHFFSADYIMGCSEDFFKAKEV